MKPKNTPLDLLKYHVTGAIERGEGQPITAIISPKHTPGPWTLKAARTLVNVKGPKGEQICQLDINDPNARFISTAPEMKDKLEVCLQRLIEKSDESSRDLGLILSIQKLISKIEGDL